MRVFRLKPDLTHQNNQIRIRAFSKSGTAQITGLRRDSNPEFRQNWNSKKSTASNNVFLSLSLSFYWLFQTIHHVDLKYNLFHIFQFQTCLVCTLFFWGGGEGWKIFLSWKNSNKNLWRDNASPAPLIPSTIHRITKCYFHVIPRKLEVWSTNIRSIYSNSFCSTTSHSSRIFTPLITGCATVSPGWKPLL